VAPKHFRLRLYPPGDQEPAAIIRPELPFELLSGETVGLVPLISRKALC